MRPVVWEIVPPLSTVTTGLVGAPPSTPMLDTPVPPVFAKVPPDCTSMEPEPPD